MTTRLHVLSAGSTMDEAARACLHHGLSGLPVVDASGRPVGVLSDQIALRAWLEALYDEWPVGTVSMHMSTAFETAAGDIDLLALAERFSSCSHSRLLVVDGESLVGVVTRKDVLRALRRLFDTGHPTTYQLMTWRRT